MFTCTQCSEERPYCAKQLCRRCYQRLYVGKLSMPPGIRKTYEQHADEATRTLDGCLLWNGPVSDRGYGTCSDPVTGEGRAHRAAYVRVHGPIPSNLEPDHRCHTNSKPPCAAGDSCTHRRCIAVEHLELVTHWENSVRSNSWGGINYRKTHCDHCGEALSQYGGQRQCASCTRRKSRESAQRRRRRLGQRELVEDPSHCRHGHAMTEENKSYYSGGKVRCRQCLNDAAARCREKRKALLGVPN